MTEEEFRDALDGLFAYDTGATDSGIKDEKLRQQCKEYMQSMPREPHELVPRVWFSRLVREMWLDEVRLAQGYGIEDAIAFLRWLDDEMESSYFW